VRVVADSQAIVWYLQDSPRISERGLSALTNAEANGGVVVSAATLVDLWYVTQTTRQVTIDQLIELRSTLGSSSAIDLHPVDEAVAVTYWGIDRSKLADPWDRLIVATAKVLSSPIVTSDRAIRALEGLDTIW